MKGKLGAKIMKNFVALKQKQYNYSANDDNEIKEVQDKTNV